MKKTISTLALLCALLISSVSIGQTYEVAYLRTIETFIGGAANCYLQLTFSDGKSERLELENLRSKGSGAVNNGEKIAKAIKKLLEAGYTLKSHSTAGTEVITTTMIFIKEEE